MTTIASPALDDLRHEMDENVSVVTSTDLKAKRMSSASGVPIAPHPGTIKMNLRIRTLPRDCNPTPVSSLNSSASGLLSPMSSRPDTPKEQQDNPFDDITEEKLKKMSGSQDLGRVTTLQISVDSSKQSVEVIGELLPSLQQLRLQQSSLSSFRDLGTSLRSLRVLWAMHCNIADLDGIGALTNLQELYLQHNNVSDISPLTMHEELRIIDLEGNNITDIGQIEQLAFCPQLVSLNLTGNPVEAIDRYRHIIENFLPQLMSLDDRAFTDSERVKLTDQEIDAAILKHRTGLQTEVPSSKVNSVPQLEVAISHQLSYSSSTTNLNGLPVDSPHNDDSGSRLTHGTDIVFAGNVSSALRRHRCETEATDSFSMIQGSSNGLISPASRPSSSHGLLDRPKTPAQRISITDTLDRAREIDADKHKSRDAIVDELKAWQLESAGASQVGVPHDPTVDIYSPGPNRSRRKVSVGDINAAEVAAAAGTSREKLERPRTSAGVLRNGATVREAFVDMTSSLPRSSPRSGLSKRCGSTSLSSKTPKVDILILDGGDTEKRPCSPIKTSRGIFTTATSSKNALGRTDEWHLDVLSSKVDITTARRHVPTSLTSKQQRERSLIASADGNSDSDSDDESSGCPVVAVESSSPQAVPKTAFFNVAESLTAIEKWRDEMEYDAEDTAVVNVVSLQLCLSPRAVTPSMSENANSSNPSGGHAVTSNQQDSPVQGQQNKNRALGPANHDTDQTIIQLLREKQGQLKTRDGFRAYFRGIEEARLDIILRQVFADSDRVQRRMQIMSGLFRHEL